MLTKTPLWITYPEAEMLKKIQREENKHCIVLMTMQLTEETSIQ